MITIDRLVLDIDGMDEPRARRLAMLAAELVAETLAGAPESGISLDRIAVSLPATGAADADIAAAIAAAIRARIG